MLEKCHREPGLLHINFGEVDVSLWSFVEENSFLERWLSEHRQKAACILFSFHVKTPV